VEGIKPKDLVGAPWLLAFALRADGWYLRSDIIWARPNPMPESVTDRPTKSHSYVFLLTKRPRYYYDADAIREDSSPSAVARAHLVKNPSPKEIARVANGDAHGTPTNQPYGAGRNARSVWNIATEPTPFAHFATFPQELVRRCILAGTSERGACPNCGAPWARQADVDYSASAHGNLRPSTTGPDTQGTNRARDGHVPGKTKVVTTTGWLPTCDCLEHVDGLFGTPDPVPCVVLDPFMGSGTTALVARHHGRHAIGCELNADYLNIARTRLQQLSLLGDIA
jgi:hypothetical protein